MKLLRNIMAVLIAVSLTCGTRAQNGLTVNNGNGQVNRSFSIGSGKAQTFLANSTVTFNGTMSGAPTGGILDLSHVTLTLPSGVGGAGNVTNSAGVLTANRVTAGNGGADVKPTNITISAGGNDIGVPGNASVTGNQTVGGNQTVTGNQTVGNQTVGGTFQIGGTVDYGSTVFPANHGGTGQSSFTKGDLLGATNSTTLGKVGIGSNGKVLTANSTATSGMSWETASGGSSSTNIILASSVAAMDGSTSANTGTDNTAVLQTALNTLRDAGGGTLYIDGKTRTTGGLKIGNNTTVDGIHGGYMFLANGSDMPLFVSEHRLDSGQRNQNITIKNLRANLNGANQNLTETGQGDHFVVGIEIIHIDGLRIENVALENSKTFNLLIGDYTKGFYVSGGTFTHSSPGVYQDGVHVWGPGTGMFYIGHISSDGLDDTIGVNIDEMGGASDANNETFGAIDGGTIEDIHCDGANQGVRLLSQNYEMGPISIRGIKGTIGSYAVHAGPTSGGPGNFTTISIEDINHMKLRPGGNHYPDSNAGAVPYFNLINIAGVVKTVKIHNVHMEHFGDARPLFYASSAASIGTLQFSDCSRDNASLEANFAEFSGAAVGSVQMQLIKLKNVDRLIKHTSSPTVTTAVISNVVSEAGGTSLIEGDGTNLIVTGYAGDVALDVSGTWTNNNLDHANLTAGAVAPTPDLIWYKLNAGSGTSLADDSAATNTGTTNAAWATPGLDFDGTTHYAYSNSSLSLSGKTAITVSGWWNLDDNTTVRLLYETSTDFDTHPTAIITYISSGALNVGMNGGSGDGGRYRSFTAPATGGLHHLVMVHDQTVSNGGGTYGDVKLYIDGVLQTGTVTQNTIATPGASFVNNQIFIGNRNSASLFYDGKLDDFRVYGRAINSTEVSAIYAAGRQ